MHMRLWTLFLASCVVALVPSVSAADEAEETEPAVEVSLVPLLSLKADVREALQCLKLYETLAGADSGREEYALFEIMEIASSSENVLAEDDPSQMVYDIHLTFPKLSMVADLVVPVGSEALDELMDIDESEVEERADGLMVGDDAAFIKTDRYVAVQQIEGNIFVKDTAARLTRLLKDVESNRVSQTLSISAKPRKVGRSPLKPMLASMKATLLTHAQQRDNDDPLSATSRSFVFKSFAAWFDALFEDTETFELNFDFSESQQTSLVELKLAAAENSTLDQYISRLSKVRSRSLSYLHPDNEAFLSMSIPLPKLLTDLLPQLSSESLVALQSAVGMSETPSPALAEVIRQLVERSQLDLLLQAVPLPSGGRAAIMVLPLDSASALEPASIQLISGLADSHWSLNDGEVAGYALHTLDGQQFGFGADLGGIDGDVYFVMTEHCLAIAVGEEELLDVLEEVITRGFDPPRAASLFARSAFAAQFRGRLFSDLEFTDVPDGIQNRLKEDEEAEIHDNVTFALNTAAQQLTISATFDPDALVAALATHEFCVEVLSAGIESLTD